eukprot:1496131-Rhodomonas_salina.1
MRSSVSKSSGSSPRISRNCPPSPPTSASTPHILSHCDEQNALGWVWIWGAGFRVLGLALNPKQTPRV